MSKKVKCGKCGSSKLGMYVKGHIVYDSKTDEFIGGQIRADRIGETYWIHCYQCHRKIKGNDLTQRINGGTFYFDEMEP